MPSPPVGRARLKLSWFRLVAYRLDVVAIRIENECAVVVRVVVETQARRPVVASTGLDGSAVEGVD